jgi:hypothetical protein
LGTQLWIKNIIDWIKFKMHKKIIISLQFSLLLFISISQHVSADGLTAAQVNNSVVPKPICSNGVCRTPAKVQWSSSVADGSSGTRFFDDPDTAMRNYAAAYYGSFDGFCRQLGSPPVGNPPRCGATGPGYQGLVDSPSDNTINGIIYPAYYGNCGATCYGNPDYRGTVIPYGFCPQGYFIGSPTSGVTWGGNGAPGPSCYARYSKYYNPKQPSSPPEECKLSTSLPFTSHPIQISQGSKSQREKDYFGSILHFTRDYFGTGVFIPNFVLGKNWQHADNRQLAINVDSSIIVSRQNGSYLTFLLASNVWTPDGDITDRLDELKDSNDVRTGWRYTVDATGEVELYDVSGKLLSVADRAGLTQTLTYSDSSTPTTTAPIAGLLIRVIDHSGR